MLETSLEEKDGNRALPDDEGVSAPGQRAGFGSLQVEEGQAWASAAEGNLHANCRPWPDGQLAGRSLLCFLAVNFSHLVLWPSHTRKKMAEFERVGLRWVIPQVFSNGRCLVGEGAVWRCPAQCPWDAHCPWDMCVWKAIAPPPGYPIPDNCLVVSAEGLANSRMAGGAGLGSRRSNRS